MIQYRFRGFFASPTDGPRDIIKRVKNLYQRNTVDRLFDNMRPDASGTAIWAQTTSKRRKRKRVKIAIVINTVVFRQITNQRVFVFVQ